VPPDPKIFVVEHGQATIQVDDTHVVAEPGSIVIAPANALHGHTLVAH
jgi:quercetin dioxygenase-like cupin family protein